MKFRYSISALMVCTLVIALTTRVATWAYSEWVIPTRPVAWQPYSTKTVEEARSSGRLVVVHFTADEHAGDAVPLNAAMETAAVRKKLHRVGAVAVLADISQIDGEERELAEALRLKRLPLTMVYPPGKESTAVMLTTIPSARDVVAGIEIAQHRKRPSS